ncbi:hypothetical protein [Streptomyces sp. enrichment culture]
MAGPAAGRQVGRLGVAVSWSLDVGCPGKTPRAELPLTLTEL